MSKARSSSSPKALPRLSIGRSWRTSANGLVSSASGGPDALGRRVGRPQRREGRLEGDELAQLRVVLRVGDGRRVLEVVGAVRGRRPRRQARRGGPPRPRARGRRPPPRGRDRRAGRACVIVLRAPAAAGRPSRDAGPRRVGAPRSAIARRSSSAQDLARARDARLARGRERPVGRAADQRRPSRPRARAMARSSPRRTPPSTQTSARPSTASTIAGERGHGRDGPVELARAVVRDDDRGRADLDGASRVLRGEDPLEHEGHAASSRRSARRRSRSAWTPPTPSRIARPPAARASSSRGAAAGQVRQGHVERERRCGGPPRGSRSTGRSTVTTSASVGRPRPAPLDERAGDAPIPLHVELEEAHAARRGGGDVLQRDARERREDQRNAGGGRGAGRRRSRRRGGPAPGRPSGRSPTGRPPGRRAASSTGRRAPTSTRTRGTKRAPRQAASLSAREISSQAPDGDVVPGGGRHALAGDRRELGQAQGGQGPRIGGARRRQDAVRPALAVTRRAPGWPCSRGASSRRRRGTPR